jgi:ABC-2 type transport system ATP-binding protein
LNLITLDSCSYAIGGRDIIKNLSLEVRQNNVNVLIGDNGIGKSLLLDMISGVINQRSGLINRRVQNDQIGYMSQQLDLPYLLTLKEAIQYFSILINPENREDNIEKIIDEMHPKVKGIALKCGHQRSSKCSIGEKKLILINLLVSRGRYKLLILDEPTSGLSPENRDIFHELCNQALSQGMTTLYTTHLIQEIAHTERVINLNESM